MVLWAKANKRDTTGRSPGQQIHLPTIHAGQILSIKSISDTHGVYRLLLQSGEAIVLKSERKSGISANLGDAYSIMGLVSGVASVALTREEVDVVNRLAPPAKSRNFVIAQDESRSNRFTWVKSAYVENIRDLGDMADNTIRPGALKKMVNTVRDLGGNHSFWRGLGRIIAADLFNGNGDRVSLHDCNIVNWGNILFTVEAKSSLLDKMRGSVSVSDIVGLDAFDPQHSYVGGDLEQNWAEKCGQYLKDERKGKDHLVRTFEWFKNEVTDKLGFVPDWSQNDLAVLLLGFAEGVSKIRDAFSRDVDNRQSTRAETTKKLEYLGWARPNRTFIGGHRDRRP